MTIRAKQKRSQRAAIERMAVNPLPASHFLRGRAYTLTSHPDRRMIRRLRRHDYRVWRNAIVNVAKSLAKIDPAILAKLEVRL